MNRGVTWIAAVLGSMAAVSPWLIVVTTRARAQEAPAAATADELRAQRDRAGAEARRLGGEGKLAEAVAAVEQMLAIERQWLGEDHPDVVGSLEQLATLHERREDWAAAESRWREALAWHTSRQGADHWATKDAQRALANLDILQRRSADERRLLADATVANEQFLQRYRAGRVAEAIPFAEEALRIRKQILGEHHDDYATSLGNLALARDAQGDYAQAESLCRQALEIRKEVFGEQHPDYALSLNNLGLLYLTMGELRLAEPLLKQACPIYKETLGAQDPAYATSLNNLGGLYDTMGDYARAETLFREALEITKSTRGEHHPDVARCFNNLAGVYQALGDYARAEPLYRQAWEITRELLDERHPHYASILNNQAGIYKAMGDFDRAEPMYQRALAIRRRTLGEQHPDYARSLHNLGELYCSMGEFGRAETFLKEALAIRQQVQGETHPEYASSLNNLGLLYWRMGDVAQAEPLYRQAVEVMQQASLTNDLSYATFLQNLGLLYATGGDVARGEPLYRQSLEIYKEILGEQHPNYAIGLNNLAALLESTGDLAGAEPRYQEALEIVSTHGEATALAQGERAQLARADRVRLYLDSYVSCLLRRGKGDVAYEAVLHWKGAILARQQAARRAADSKEVAPVLSQLQSVVRQWTAMTSSAPQGDPAAWKQRRDDLKSLKEHLEAELVRLSSDVRAATQTVSIEQLGASLPADAALVDYFQYGIRPPSAEKPSDRVTRRSLAAFVVRPGRAVEMFDLGPAEPITVAIEQWRASFGGSAESQAAGALLRERLWQPMERAIGDAHTVLVSPDRALGGLPFRALPGRAPGTFLIEDHRIALAPVPRLIPAQVESGLDMPVDNELLLLGGVDYDRREESAGATHAPEDLLAVAQSRGDVRATAGNLQWPTLPGAAAEVAMIGDLYGQFFQDTEASVADLRGAAATEENFRALAPHYRLIHLATHGFFAPEKDETSHPDNFNGTIDAPLGAHQAASQPALDAGMLSGLVLAGANAPPSLPDDPAEFENLPEDGILTAEEVASLRLTGVQLVVMSACETGLGKSAGGEGLLGIQRAFQIAGVRTTVASLWKVDDVWTERLMTAFYRNVLQGKQSYLDALRYAQLEILAELRDSGGAADALRGADAPQDAVAVAHASPYYWAAFTLSGDWR